MPASPFDLIKDVSFEKAGILDEVNRSEWNDFLANRNFSLYLDTVMYANQLNFRNPGNSKASYLFYLNGIKSRKRYKKWPKKATKDVLVMLCQLYNCGMNEARQYASLLTEEQIEKIKANLEKGDKS